MITREKLGYAPGTMDAVYLAQDLDEFDAALETMRSGGALLRRSEEIEAEARRLAIPEMIVKARLQRARLLLASRRPREAIAALTEARETLGHLRQHDLAVSVYAALAQAQAALGHWQAASETCDAGLALVEAHRYSVSGQYLQSAYLRSRIGLYSTGVRAAFETGDYERMLLRAELSKCRSVLRARRRTASSPGEKKAERAFRAACEEIDRARAEDRGEEALGALLAKRRNLWDLLLFERSRAGEDALPQFSLRDAQAALADDEAALYYYWAGEGELVIAAIAGDALMVEMARISPEQLRTLRNSAAQVLATQDPETPEFADCLNELDGLAGVLLPPSIAEALRKKSSLLISPHRMLHSVPFHALDHDGEPLIRRFAITYVPNLTCLLAPRARTEGPRRLLAIGIAEYDIPGWPLRPLADAEKEVADLGRLYAGAGAAATMLRGREVMERRVKTQLETVTTLHVATHGFNVSEDTPMESHLFLHDSLLDGLDIASWHLGADLVVLSACCSGQRAIAGRGMTELPGDDLFGLQSRVLCAAGARQVLGSLWPVQSKVAYGMMTAFHRFLLEGQSSARALQSAVADHLATAGPRSRKRVHWAPFFLCAAGRSE